MLLFSMRLIQKRRSFNDIINLTVANERSAVSTQHVATREVLGQLIFSNQVVYFDIRTSWLDLLPFVLAYHFIFYGIYIKKMYVFL